MAEYRRSAHAVFDIKYHVVWITKYRYKVLRGRVAERTRDLIRQTCDARDVLIVRGAVSPDHVHMLLSAPADQAPAKLVQTRRISGTEEALLGPAHLWESPMIERATARSRIGCPIS